MKPLTVPGTLESLDVIAKYVMEAAAEAGLERKSAYGIRLAADELATNIISHGYGESGREGVLELRADIDDRTLKISIEDTGIPFDPREHERADTSLPLDERPMGGLGLHLVILSVDEFRYERVGDRNRSVLVMNLPSRSPEE